MRSLYVLCPIFYGLNLKQKTKGKNRVVATEKNKKLKSYVLLVFMVGTRCHVVCVAILKYTFLSGEYLLQLSFFFIIHVVARILNMAKYSCKLHWGVQTLRTF